MGETTDPEEYRNGPAPPHLRESPLLRYLWRRMHVNNKNAMVCIVGDPGDGKSWAAIRIAELLDPAFWTDNIAFTTSQMLRRIEENHPAGDITVVDEAGVSMNAKTWWEEEQLHIENILETWRHQNRGLITTVPIFSHMQKGARELFDVIMTAYGIDRKNGTSAWRFQLLSTNNKTGEVYEPYPKLPDKNGVEKKWEKIHLEKPSKQLREAYEPIKEEYTADLNKEARERAEADEAAEDDDMDVEDVVDDITKNNLSAVIGENGRTGEPMVDKDLIRVEYDISVRDARTVKKLVEKQVNLDEEVVL